MISDGKKPWRPAPLKILFPPLTASAFIYQLFAFFLLLSFGSGHNYNRDRSVLQRGQPARGAQVPCRGVQQDQRGHDKVSSGFETPSNSYTHLSQINIRYIY